MKWLGFAGTVEPVKFGNLREFRISGGGASGVREWGGGRAARGWRKFGNEFRWGLRRWSCDRKWLGRGEPG